jgi:hypothetical protein
LSFLSRGSLGAPAPPEPCVMLLWTTVRGVGGGGGRSNTAWSRMRVPLPGAPCICGGGCCCCCCHTRAHKLHHGCCSLLYHRSHLSLSHTSKHCRRAEHPPPRKRLVQGCTSSQSRARASRSSIHIDTHRLHKAVPSQGSPHTQAHVRPTQLRQHAHSPAAYVPHTWTHTAAATPLRHTHIHTQQRHHYLQCP